MYDRLPEVELFACTKGDGAGPEELSVYGALGCFEQPTSLELFVNDAELSQEKRTKKIERILAETSGRGHGSVLDQNTFVFAIKDIPRIATLHICQPQYLAHLQQSLRRATADRGFYLPEEIMDSKYNKEVKELLNDAFMFYDEMRENGVPAEDARYVLPLYTRTNIQTLGDARELMHLHHMSRKPELPSVIRYVVEKMIEKAKEVAPRLMKERETNYEVLAWYPSAQLFAQSNQLMKSLIERYDKKDLVVFIDGCYDAIPLDDLERIIKERDETGLAMLKHLHFTFLAKMSLACWHQAIRQRTWDQSVESIYDAIERGEFKMPPSIERSKFNEAYQNFNEQLQELYFKLVEDGVPSQEAIGIISHALMVWDLIHINGWNAIHSIGKRTCTKAQWEIRGVATEIANEIKRRCPELGRFAEPQGIVYGRCPEREPCGRCISN